MEGISRQMLVVYAAAVLAIALVGARYLKTAATADGGASRPSTSYSVSRGGKFAGATRSFGGTVVIHVAGAVRRPGLVTLRDGDRVGTAIKRAGGPAHGADLQAINLAMRLADGQQVVVPRRGVVVGGGAGGDSAAFGATVSAGPISLNSATVEQLDQLDGIGPGLAAKIIAARQARGGFSSLDDLGEVPGIGDKRLESLRGQLQP